MAQAEAKAGLNYITQTDFSGGINIADNPVKLADKELSNARNYVIDGTDLRQRKGFTFYNTTAIGATTGIRSFRQFKNIKGDQHLVVQADDGVVYLGSAAAPTAGSFASLFTETASAEIACFTEIDHKLIMTNGVDHPQIYEGTYGECQGFLVTRSTTAPVDTKEAYTYYDYEVEVSDEDSNTYAWAGALPTLANGGQILIGSQVPNLTGVRIVLVAGGLNTNDATITAQYWGAAGWTACPDTVSDGTLAATAHTLGQTGNITWGTITDAYPTLINDQHRYWYRLTVSAALSATVKISACYLMYNMQDLPQAWGGVLVNPIHCVLTQDNATTYTSYLTEVTDSDATTALILDNFDTVANGDWLVIGASTKFSALYVEILKPNGTAAHLHASYWKESTGTWADLTIANDGTFDAATLTKTLGESGYIFFGPPSDWIQSDSTGRGTPAYEIRLTASEALDAEVEVSALSVIPYADALEPYRLCLGLKDRLLLGGPLSEKNRIDVSAESNIYDLTGTDSDSLYIPSNLSITALCSFYNEAFISTAEDIHLLQGHSPSTFSFLRIETEKVGALNQASIVPWGKNLFFAHSNGFYVFDGMQVQNISADKIKPFFDSTDATYFIPLTRLPYIQGRWNPLDETVEWTVSMGDGQATNNFILTFSPEKKAWMFHDFLACSMGNLIGTNGEMQAYHGDYKGRLQRANVATTDNSVAITSYFSTRGLSGGPEQKNILCMFRGIQIRAKAQDSGSLVVTQALDGTSTFSSFCTISMEGTSSFAWLPFYDPLYGLSLIYKVTNSTSGVLPIINELRVPFNPVREEALFIPAVIGDAVAASATTPTGLWVDARSYASLEAANTAAVAANKLLVISSNYTLTANTTLTASVMRVPGGSFTHATGFTLTINGSFSNPDNGQCFIGFDAGDVTFAVGTIKEVLTEWFGAKADNSTDCTSAFAQAMATDTPTVMRHPIILLDGTYLTDYWVLKPYLKMICAGVNNTIIKRNASSTSGHFITLLAGQISTNGMKLKDFTVDGDRIGTDLDGINIAGVGQNFSQWSSIETVRVMNATGYGFRLYCNVSEGKNIWATSNKVGIYLDGSNFYGYNINAEGNENEDAILKCTFSAIYGLQTEGGGICAPDAAKNVIDIQTHWISLYDVYGNHSEARNAIVGTNGWYVNLFNVSSGATGPTYSIDDTGGTGQKITRPVTDAIPFFTNMGQPIYAVDITMYGALTIGAGTQIKKFTSGTIAIDPGSIASVTRGAITWTLTGVAAGDRVIMHPPADLNDDLIFVGSKVTGANTVTVYLYNPTGGAIDDGELTWEYEWFDLT